MGKYDAVVGKLQRDAPGGEPRFREKVEARKQDIVELETKLLGVVKPGALALRYVTARRQKDLIAEQESEANVEIQACAELLQVALEAEGLSSLKLSDGTSVTIGQEPTASIIDKDKLLAWAKANGYERMLTLHSQTVAALAKELLLSGDALSVDEDGNMTVMDGSVRVASRATTKMTRA